MTKRTKLKAVGAPIREGDHVRVVRAYGSQEGLTGEIIKKADRTNLLFMRADQHLDDPTYQNYLFGPYSENQLKKIQDPKREKRRRVRVLK